MHYAYRRGKGGVYKPFKYIMQIDDDVRLPEHMVCQVSGGNRSVARCAHVRVVWM